MRVTVNFYLCFRHYNNGIIYIITEFINISIKGANYITVFIGFIFNFKQLKGRM
ncbi:hypothetical protein C0J52_20936 [Blattella germanica]|nr:hypothetical protein C0J52_20936 [Blattella germanica]